MKKLIVLAWLGLFVFVGWILWKLDHRPDLAVPFDLQPDSSLDSPQPTPPQEWPGGGKG